MVDAVMDTTDVFVAAAPAAPAQHDQASKTLSGYLGEKGQEWKAVYDRKRPLTLLELPVDILRLIVKEARHRPPETLSCVADIGRFRSRTPTT
jgi:hypothetical protein